MRNRFMVFIIVSSLAIVPVGLSGADREHQQIMADVRMLQEQTVRLQLIMRSLDESLHQILEKMDTQANVTRRAFADHRLVIDGVAGGIRIVREKLEDSNVRISSLSQEVEALRVTIPPVSPTSAQILLDPITGLPIETPLPSAIPSNRSVLNPGVSPQRMYDTAWSDYANGQWELAIQGFEAYVKAFPRSEFADDAQFYVGQTHYADGAFEEAIQAFEQVFRSYPNGDIIPEVSYKRGLALDRLGEIERAQQAFQLVVEDYPDSSMATLAQQALDRLTQ
jgi:tol-pal system protein YbgF